MNQRKHLQSLSIDDIGNCHYSPHLKESHGSSIEGLGENRNINVYRQPFKYILAFIFDMSLLITLILRFTLLLF